MSIFLAKITLLIKKASSACNSKRKQQQQKTTNRFPHVNYHNSAGSEVLLVFFTFHHKELERRVLKGLGLITIILTSSLRTVLNETGIFLTSEWKLKK